MKPLYTVAEFEAAKSRQPLPLVCSHCTKTFYRTKKFIQVAIWNERKGRKHSADFCSIQCHNAAITPPTQVNCTQCGKPFNKGPKEIKKSPHHFCCQSCSARWTNTHKTKGTRVSKLEKWLAIKLPESYPSLEFHFNRKDAINGELDIFIPALRLAFELNGIFHYEPIYGLEKLGSIKSNDQRKFAACHERSIELCVIDVSTMQKFKEHRAVKFLTIIQDIINARLASLSALPAMVEHAGLEPATYRLPACRSSQLS